MIAEHRRVLTASGALAVRRAEQQRTWMWSLIRERLESRLRTSAAVRAALPRLEADVQAGTITSTAAADELLAAFDRDAR